MSMIVMTHESLGRIVVHPDAAAVHELRGFRPAGIAAREWVGDERTRDEADRQALIAAERAAALTRPSAKKAAPAKTDKGVK